VAAASGARCDVLVLIDHWGDIAQSVYSRRRVFMYHDTRLGGWDDTPRCVRWADTTLVDSDYGSSRLTPGLPPGGSDRLAVLALPVRLKDYSEPPSDRGNRLLYSSMPDRGLLHLARVFPRIKVRVPDAELHITGDFTMYGWPGARGDYQPLFHQVPGVYYHGHVRRPQLVALQRSAKVLAFPCTFPEGFCIAAAEAMAAGAVPVCSGDFALTTTVGRCGVLIPGHPARGRRPHRWLYLRRFVQEVIRLLREKERWARKSSECRSAAAARFSSAAWYEAFTKLIGLPEQISARQDSLYTAVGTVF
jgi:glycosyltransferase involved in cell wall biosynthesis